MVPHRPEDQKRWDELTEQRESLRQVLRLAELRKLARAAAFRVMARDSHSRRNRSIQIPYSATSRVLELSVGSRGRLLLRGQPQPVTLPAAVTVGQGMSLTGKALHFSKKAFLVHSA